MNKISRSVCAGAALVLALAGCQKSDAPAVTSNGAPPDFVTSASPIPQFPKGDPSVPDASSVFAAQDAADSTTSDSTALQRKPDPQEMMTRTEESRAMPLPGQANDHSTTALDKNKGG